MPAVSFPTLEFPHLADVELPRVVRARLNHPVGDAVADVPAAVRAAVEGSERLRRLPPGASVAVALGSRGIARIAEVAGTAIAALRDMGLAPFVVPAMGSHGGGTAEGQIAVLDRLGLTETTLGAPIRATMETVDYGTTDAGTRCKFDRNAAGADAVVVINRVKSHTTFDRAIESGLVKMVTVGLGKAEGARAAHRTGPPALTDVVPAVARVLLEKAPIALGIALVENPDKSLIAVEGVAPADFHAADERLLKRAKAFIARLPFDPLDVLVVEQIGKDISGAGMDHAVTGRADLRSIPNPAPFVSRIVVLGLSAATGGNGLGVGLADFTTVDVTRKIDLQQIYMNSLTSTLVEKSRFPIVLANDRDAMRAAVSTCWSPGNPQTRMCVIRSTLNLDEVLVSEPLVAELRDSAVFGDCSEPFALDFADNGRLLSRAYAADETLRAAS